MALVLSKGVKNALDTVLALAGLVLANLTSGALQLPGVDTASASVVGAIGGYLVSDAISVVDTGVAPTTATVVTQLGAAYGLSRPLIAAEIAKLPAGTEQNAANFALTVLDSVVANAK